MKVYHRTTDTSAAAILQSGFIDHEDSFGTTRQHRGVWVSDQPLDSNEGATGDTLLAIEIGESLIAPFEWIEEGKPYREWLVPAALVNTHGTVTRELEE